MIRPAGPSSAKTIRLALRWMLILVTALILAPPGHRIRLDSFESILVLGFVASNVVLSFLPASSFSSRKLEYVIVIADTFLVSVPLFHASGGRIDLPLVFFVTLFLTALCSTLPRIMAGTLLVSGLYVFLAVRTGDGMTGEDRLTSLLLRLPFLYVVGLYYGFLVHQARLEQDRTRRMEREKRELETFLEISAVTNSSLEPQGVLHIIVQRIAALVEAVRCSILKVDARDRRCVVLASSDDPSVAGVELDLEKYPEVLKAIATRAPVVIDDVDREPLMSEVRQRVAALGFQSILVLPMLHHDDLLGMLFLRKALRQGHFSPDEIAACQIVANASATALRNAMLFEQLQSAAQSWNEMLLQLQSKDLALRRAHDDLEKQVEERTRQLRQEIGDRRQAEEALRQSEERLRQSLKLEAVGRLAGGIAHDFNNVLTAITGYGELMLRSLKDRDPLRSNLEQIMKAGQLATALIRQLLAFSRRQVLAPKILSLNGIVSDMERMLRRLIGENIDLVIGLQPDLGRVKADPGQIEQVIMNLAVNARDAMPLGGTLTISSRDIELDEAFVRQHPPAQAGSYVMLGVSDTGSGMDEETRAHVFEPFFTTKEVGKGTGLGLSTVYGIVKQSGGYIWVASEPGRGATFTIYLPRVEETADALEPGPTAPAAGRGTETVLLVEDEDLVREMTRKILEIRGYTVLEAPHGAEAIRICERHQGPIHLILTDVVMPHLSGRELYERLATLRPDTKVLYMSGYASTDIVQGGFLSPSTVYLQKPFTHHGLEQKVRSVLDAAPGT